MHVGLDGILITNQVDRIKFTVKPIQMFDHSYPIGHVRLILQSEGVLSQASSLQALRLTTN